MRVTSSKQHAIKTSQYSSPILFRLSLLTLDHSSFTFKKLSHCVVGDFPHAIIQQRSYLILCSVNWTVDKDRRTREHEKVENWESRAKRWMVSKVDKGARGMHKRQHSSNLITAINFLCLNSVSVCLRLSNFKSHSYLLIFAYVNSSTNR